MSCLKEIDQQNIPTQANVSWFFFFYDITETGLSALKHRLAGLVVKASTSGTEDPGFKSRLQQDFSGSSHTSDLKIGTQVATLPGTWLYRVSTGTGRLRVSILWWGEM